MSSSPCPHVCRSQRSSCQPRLLTCQTNIYTHTFAVLLIIYLSLFPLCVHNILAFYCLVILFYCVFLHWTELLHLSFWTVSVDPPLFLTLTHICIHSPVNSTVDTLVSICLHPDLLVVLHICHTCFILWHSEVSCCMMQQTAWWLDTVLQVSCRPGPSHYHHPVGF